MAGGLKTVSGICIGLDYVRGVLRPRVSPS
jgi:hypothetical protein